MTKAPLFDVDRILASRLVAQVDYHESIGSTNDRALTLGAQDECRTPLLVLAERQTAGRGRGTNAWFATEGAITFSFLLAAPPEQLPLSRWPQVALAAGLAVADALRDAAPKADVQVKWPNDVYLAGRKLGGILSESVPGCRDRLVVGMGINVNNSFSLPSPNDADLRVSTPNAISLLDYDRSARDLTSVLVAVLDQFDRRWQELLDDRFPTLVAAYRERCFLTNKIVTLRQFDNREMVGVCSGIDDFGRLQLLTECGHEAVASGTITSWQDAVGRA